MKQAWVIVFLFVTSFSIWGQIIPIENDYYTRFYNLTVADGLPGNHVTVIRQDSLGFMWIGTREGLACFDGTRFHTFHHIPGDSSSIASDYINDILITNDQTIFVGTKQGLSIFDHKTFTFEQVPLLFDKGYGLHNNHIRALLADDDEHIWVETFDGVHHHLNTETYTADVFPHDKPSQPYYDYHALLSDSQGTLWIGGRNMGPLKMIKPGSITKVATDPDNPQKKRETDVAFYFEDSQNVFWVGGYDGLYQYNRDKDIFELGT
jgi:ligand-binding sensor domain-containing protein